MRPPIMVPQNSQGSLWLQYCSRPAVCVLRRASRGLCDIVRATARTHAPVRPYALSTAFFRISVLHDASLALFNCGFVRRAVGSGLYGLVCVPKPPDQYQQHAQYRAARADSKKLLKTGNH